jgi:hypothetical protein
VIAARAVGFHFEDSYEKPGLGAIEVHCDGVRRAMAMARVSVGSGPMRAAMGLTQRIAREWRERGTYRLMLEGAIGYAEADGLFRE